MTLANQETERPTLIIGKTIMAKGAVQADGTSYEGDFRTHGAPLGGDAYINTIKKSLVVTLKTHSLSTTMLLNSMQREMQN